jgi:hypothetical protein
MKRDFQRPSRITLVSNGNADPQIGKQHLQLVQTTARQTNMLRMLLSASDNARLSIGGQAHGLGFVKFGILKRGHPHQAILQSGGELILGDVDLIAQNQFELPWQRPLAGWFFMAGRGSGPWLSIIVFRRDELHTDDPSPFFRTSYDPLGSQAIDSTYRREQRPLVDIRH